MVVWKQGLGEGLFVTREVFNLIWETAAIFAAIFALLFWKFSSQGVALRWGVLLGALALMLVVTYRRLRRLHRARQEQQGPGSPPPPGPLPPLPPQ